MSATVFLLLLTGGVSLAAFNQPGLRDRLIFNPFVIQSRGEWYRFLTSGLIHSDWIHLFVNMFVFYSFGPRVEEYFDYLFEGHATYYFLLLYFGAMITSILPTFRKYRHQPSYNALGASGAVSGIVFSFILFNPLERLCLYGILCLPGILFGAGYLIYCYYMDKKGGGRINHDAHLWGAVFGFVFTVFLKPELFLLFFQKLVYFRQVL